MRLKFEPETRAKVVAPSFNLVRPGDERRHWAGQRRARAHLASGDWLQLESRQPTADCALCWPPNVPKLTGPERRAAEARSHTRSARPLGPSRHASSAALLLLCYTCPPAGRPVAVVELWAAGRPTRRSAGSLMQPPPPPAPFGPLLKGRAALVAGWKTHGAAMAARRLVQARLWATAASWASSRLGRHSTVAADDGMAPAKEKGRNF